MTKIFLPKPQYDRIKTAGFTRKSEKKVREGLRRQQERENLANNVTGNESLAPNLIEKAGDSGIMRETNDKGKADVHIVGKIDKKIYSCITDDIVTDEVIITDERIAHIKERHPDNYEMFMKYIPNIISDPEYIIEAGKPNTAVILKEIDENGKKFKVILRIKVKTDPKNYQNSILSFWYIGETTWRKNLKNKKILYSRE